VLYGADHSKDITTPSSQPGDIPTVSTLTPPDITQATKAYEIRLTTMEDTLNKTTMTTREVLMGEMRTLTAKSDARTKKLEDLTKSTESLMMDFVSNSKTQAEELNTCYSQMEVVTNLTTNTAEKMDKLQTTMTAFMLRIGTTIDTLSGRTTTSDLASDLTTYLDGDGEENLDLETILKRKSPPPAAADGLRGGGGKR